MELVEKFANRVDNDSGFDNLKLAKDLAEMAEEHYSEQCNIPHVGRSLLCDDCLFDGMDKVLIKENNCLSCTQKLAKE